MSKLGEIFASEKSCKAGNGVLKLASVVPLCLLAVENKSFLSAKPSDPRHIFAEL
jgi:hypothetical protein